MKFEQSYMKLRTILFSNRNFRFSDNLTISRVPSPSVHIAWRPATFLSNNELVLWTIKKMQSNIIFGQQFTNYMSFDVIYVIVM
jgi:hypothetical protein